MEARFSLRVPCHSCHLASQHPRDFRPFVERPAQFARRTIRSARVFDRNLALSVIARAEMSSDEQVVRFRNEHDEELVGWLRDAGSKDNLVIFCHGYFCGILVISKPLSSSWYGGKSWFTFLLTQIHVQCNALPFRAPYSCAL